MEALYRSAGTGGWMTETPRRQGRRPVRDGGEPRAVIFDMEGVLVDSERSPHAWHRLCR